MPIMTTKKKPVRASTSTHSGNGGNVDVEEQSSDDLENHMGAETLTDPEDTSHGSTHSMTTASTEQNVGTIDNDIDPAEGYLTEAEATEQNVGTIDNDVDPASGYLEGAATSVDEDEEDEEDGMGTEDFVEANFEVEGEEESGLENNNEPTPLEAGEEDFEEDEDEEAPEEDTMSDIAEDEAGIGAPAEEELDVEDLPGKGEELPLVDVDETPDTEVNVAFASFGTRLMVIRANRIIATMTKKMAIAGNREDIYLTDQFQEVTAAELEKRGLRKGLKSMGFTLAKVNVTKASVVNARVELTASKKVAAIRQVAASKDAAFQQSLTIAAVGINRRYFNDVQNELRAHLEEELNRAGMRGGSKMLQRAFAQFGPSYAKAIVELASKISAMPQASRDGFVAALDLTSEDMDVPEEDVVPVGQSGQEADNNSDDMGEEFEDDTVTASLSSPGHRLSASVKPGNYSLAASAILSGGKPLVLF